MGGGVHNNLSTGSAHPPPPVPQHTPKFSTPQTPSDNSICPPPHHQPNPNAIPTQPTPIQPNPKPIPNCATIPTPTQPIPTQATPTPQTQSQAHPHPNPIPTHPNPNPHLPFPSPPPSRPNHNPPLNPSERIRATPSQPHQVGSKSANPPLSLYRRLGGAQPGNRFVSFMCAYAQSGCLVYLDQNMCWPIFS